jgi:hypothetical protein
VGAEGAGVDNTDCAPPSEAGTGGSDEEMGVREWAKEGVAIDSEELLGARRFGELPRRWVG